MVEGYVSAVASVGASAFGRGVHRTPAPFGKEEIIMKKYYLAYGSNLNVQQMCYRCPDATIFGTAEIPDYQLLFKGSMTGSYLTIEKKEGSTVPVAVWEVSERDELRLDAYEGYPNFYYKTDIQLTVKSHITGRKKKLDAFVYIMHEERELGIPSRAYLQTCLIGYRHFGFKPALLMKAIAVSEGGAK